MSFSSLDTGIGDSRPKLTLGDLPPEIIDVIIDQIPNHEIRPPSRMYFAISYGPV